LDFTIEFWLKTTQTTPYACVVTRDWQGSPYTGGWSILLNSPSSGSIQVWVADYSTGAALVTASTAGYNDGNWHHIALVRNGTGFTLYLDGVSVGTATSSLAFAYVSKPVTVADDGTFGGGARAFNGSLDDFRIVRGKAMYTSGFTPPAGPHVVG
jgi:hypothetical protein